MPQGATICHPSEPWPRQRCTGRRLAFAVIPMDGVPHEEGFAEQASPSRTIAIPGAENDFMSAGNACRAPCG